MKGEVECIKKIIVDRAWERKGPIELHDKQWVHKRSKILTARYRDRMKMFMFLWLQKHKLTIGQNALLKRCVP